MTYYTTQIQNMRSLKFILAAFIFAVVTPKLNAQSSDQGRKFDALLSIISQAYVDTTNQKELTEDAIRAMLKDLDPHSVYLDAEELKQVNEPLVGKFEGIGVQFQLVDDTIMVTQVIAGGPSEKLGIRAGDRIVKIDGENVTNIKLTNRDVLKRLRGDKGTKVTVSMFRRDEKELTDFTITRDKIPLYSVDATYMATPDIGYIKISRFADSTVFEFRAALETLKSQGMKSLVLDLQGNGGGYLNRAIELADEFLAADKLIVYTQGRIQSRMENYSTAYGGWEKGKVVILVDESSASASEIVTGALQDHDRALVVGRRTYAKGLVQKPFSLPDGSAVRLTIARYYTPSGRCIQKAYGKGEKGDEDYDADLSNRMLHGELYSADSIKFIDSLKYFTDAKRTVFGGGGIMPDVFIPLDTSMNSKYYDDLRRKGILADFAFNYADDNRSSLLKNYPDVKTFKNNFQLTPEILYKLFAYAEKKDVKKDELQYATSERLIKTQIKALIARDLWNTNAYHFIVNDIINSYTKAIQCIEDNTFDKMKIAEMH